MCTGGAAEATAIAYAQQGIEPPRPLTHDLLKNVIEGLGHQLTEVRIVELKDGVFHAALVFDGKVEISSRSSDAIALAVRVDIPVFVEEAVLAEAGIVVPEDTDDSADDDDEESTGDAEDEVERFREFLDSVSPEDFGGEQKP